MRRWAIVLVFLLGVSLLGGSTSAGGEKKGAPVSIEYYGQSFFILTTSKGTRIAFDPHTIPDYFEGRPFLPNVDAVCISHNHNDHIRVEVFKEPKSIKVIRGLKSPSIKADWATVDETVKDVKIRTVGVYHDTTEGLERGKNAVFIIEVDGWKIVHLGDLGHLLTPSQLKRIGSVDVLMVPVGGIYTLNGSEAKKVVEQLKPKEYIFPMHYGTKVFDAVLPVDEFLEDVEKRRVATTDENTITLNRDPQRPRPLIVVLHYWPKEKKEEEKKKDDKKK